jgi:PAS domain S-box-containing protein
LADENRTDLLERILSLTSEFFYSIEVSPDGRLSKEEIIGALEGVTGFSPEELDRLGGPEGIIYPADVSKFKGLLKAAWAGEEATVEYRVVAKDGEIRTLRDRAVPVTDDDGNVVRVIGVVGEATKAAEVKEPERGPRDGYYRMLFDAAGDAISIVDPETEIVLDVNVRACELYGFSREEFIGLSFVTLTKQKVRGKMKLNEFVNTGVSPVHRTVHYTKDGRELHLEIKGSIVEIDGKKALMSIHREITEREERLTSPSP